MSNVAAVVAAPATQKSEVFTLPRAAAVVTNAELRQQFKKLGAAKMERLQLFLESNGEDFAAVDTCYSRPIAQIMTDLIDTDNAAMENVTLASLLVELQAA